MNRMKEFRKGIKMTQEQLAYKTGTTRQWIILCEKNDEVIRKARPENIKKICRVLKKTPFETFGSALVMFKPKTDEDIDFLIESLEELKNAKK